jgi:Rieske Fe-S protein
MQRRDFLKGTCRICLLGSAGAAVIQLASCSPSFGQNIIKSEIADNKITIPIALFNTNTFQLISPKKYPYEIALQKEADGTYKALLLKCTHYENQLQPTGNSYSCSLHGSRFNKEGAVLKGPASEPLIQLTTTLTTTDILIHLI